MHGQYDWMGDPGLNSRMYEWDTVCPSEQWKYSPQLHPPHLHQHPRQGPRHRLRHPADGRGPAVAAVLPRQPALRLPADGRSSSGASRCTTSRSRTSSAGRRSLADNKPLYPGLMRKVRNQALKDYLLFPALTGPLFPLTLAGNATANLIRNVWAFNIIFCGHFPAGVATFSQEETEDETARPVVLPAAARLGQHHRRQAVPPDDRQPVAPDRAPPVPGPAGPPLPGDRRRGPRALRALRPAVQHRPARQAARQRGAKICRFALPGPPPTAVHGRGRVAGEQAAAA